VRTPFWRLLAIAAGVAAFSAAGCHSSRSGVPTRLAAGDAVWFEDGTADGAGTTEAGVAHGGFGSVFLTHTILTPDGERWIPKEIAPPAHPFSKLAVTLVITAGEDARAALADPRKATALSDAVWLAAKAALRDGPRFGPLRGIHVDVPFASANAEAYGTLLNGLRTKLPKSLLLTWSLHFSPAETEHEALRKLADGADGIVSFVFGDEATADPAATDQLDRPWLAVYRPAARGRWLAGGSPDRRLPESVLAHLTNDPRVEFAHDLSLKEESASAFLLTPHEPLSAGGVAFHANDQVQFRQPSLSDMVYRFGADLNGRRFVRGRVVAVSGRTEADRIFTVAALNDILLGHPLNSDLRITIEPGRSAITVSAENPTPHASMVSRTSNWVEVDVPQGGISDVRAGGFDRFEVFGPDGGAVTLGRATRLRFFETLVGPFEKIEAARIVVRRPPAKGCCAHRIHVLSSAGAEVTREGDDTPAAAAPSAPPEKATRKK